MAAKQPAHMDVVVRELVDVFLSSNSLLFLSLRSFRIVFMRSLRSKILLLAICVVVAAQAFTVGGILYNAKEKSREQAYDNLRVGVATVDKFMADHAQGMRLLLLSILDDPSFRKSMSSDDSPQIVAELAKHTSRLIADIVVIVDASGSVLYSATDDLPMGTMISEAPLVSGAPFTSVIDAVAYEMVADNLMFAGKPAYLVIGALIGNEYALQIASIAGLQTSFATGSKAGRLFLGSSLDPLDRNLMIASIEEMRSSGTVSNALNEVNRRFVSTRTPFVSKQGQVYLLLHQSLDIALAPYKSLQVFLFYLVATTLLVVGIIVWLVSTLMTRPLHKLSDAVKRITIGDYTKKVEVNTRDEIGALAHVFNAMQDGIEDRESSILQQSLTDPVTGLPNRQHALSILRERIGRGNQIAVLLMDLGRFEHIRSTLGHKVSDEMLRLSAARIKRSLHEDAMLARLEGDEFLLVIPVSGVDAAINEAETNLALLESGLSIRKARVSLEVHIGISLYPEHGDSADDLLRHASVAKHEAIRSRSPMKVYQEGKGEAHARRLQILSDLRVAIDEHQLELYMQPKVCMTSGDVVGAEALVRWNHPELGEIMPGEFIPMLEESGSISQLTHWVLAEALHHCALWKHDEIDLPVSVNLSVQDLKHEGLATVIDQMLLDLGLKPRNLVLEITEQALTQNLTSAVDVLNHLRKRGIRISMDDFGTGYSSLHQLKHLPIDELKIDRDFIRELPSDQIDIAIVRATIQLAKTMGLDVVAEGVESEEGWHFLAGEGCKEAQGYLVSKPMQATSFSSWKQSYARARHASVDKGEPLTFSTVTKLPTRSA